MNKLRRIVFCVCALAVVALCAAAVAAHGVSAHWSARPAVAAQARFSRAAPRRAPARAGFAAPPSVSFG